MLGVSFEREDDFEIFAFFWTIFHHRFCPRTHTFYSIIKRAHRTPEEREREREETDLCGLTTDALVDGHRHKIPVPRVLVARRGRGLRPPKYASKSFVGTRRVEDDFDVEGEEFIQTHHRRRPFLPPLRKKRTLRSSVVVESSAGSRGDDDDDDEGLWKGRKRGRCSRRRRRPGRRRRRNQRRLRGHRLVSSASTTSEKILCSGDGDGRRRDRDVQWWAQKNL